MRSVTNREWKEKGAESREGCQTHNTHNEHVVVWQGGFTQCINAFIKNTLCWRTRWFQSKGRAIKKKNFLWKQHSGIFSCTSTCFWHIEQNVLEMFVCVSTSASIKSQKTKTPDNPLMFVSTCLYPLAPISLPSHHQLMCVALKSNLLSFKWIWSPSAELAKPHINSPAAPF